MSRIGKLPVAIPTGVTVEIGEDNLVTVKGPKGELAQKLHPKMIIVQEDGQIKVTRPDDEKESRALHGLTRSLVHNMVVGVSAGCSRNLDIVGVGYRAQKQGQKLTLNIGYSHPVEFFDGDGIVFEVPTPNRIVVSGIDKQKVGNVAATVRAVRQPEPYLGKGIKYDDEVVRRKEGKTGKK